MCKKMMCVYQYLILFGGFLKSPILLLCRLYFGWIFFQAGLNKFQDIHRFATTLESYHLFLPTFQAYAVTLVETIGGFCLMLGLASRFVAIPLIIVMLTAYYTVHWEAFKSIFTKPSDFVAQSPFNPLLISLIILAFGPGRFSIDYLIEKWICKKKS